MKLPKIPLGYYYLKLNNLIQELSVIFAKISRQFVRPKFPTLPNSEVNLHLGCGSLNHPSFINIDGRPDAHIHYIRSLDNLSPFEDNSVNLIYACHCLEHFSFYDTHNVLSEWYRVLKPNGILRLSVPDFDLLIAIYQDIGGDIEPIMGLFMGGQNYKFNFHKTLFNAQTLEKALLKAGFSEVTPWQPGTSDLTTFDDWSGRWVAGKYPVSLNLECSKSILSSNS